MEIVLVEHMDEVLMNALRLGDPESLFKRGRTSKGVLKVKPRAHAAPVTH